ncbi:MAG: bifunctional pyr operon transcriptional regulator/uracil phosphoribosyltransferase PyrR [Bacteroidetes bacterium]|jgi:pyrimidine operon attenuation protein/uracil phosphoribosyltransferase|nr:bifunctional pyr operon transcriptional regulator/uracil phosphoribosyltransferase PyrR [Bacteroidota bacterium]
MTASARTLIMSPERVQRTLRRLAYEIVEHNRGAQRVELFGILQSGLPLAEALAREIGRIEDADLTAHGLNVMPFRDDRDTEASASAEAPVDVTDRDVILVDDVLFTGRTARAALDAVVQFGRPRSIQLVVLIDRGHREYPIQPDYVGRQLQTKHREQVTVATGEDIAVYIED